MGYTGKMVDLSKFDKDKEVELSSEVVELGLQQDFDRAHSKAIDSGMAAGEILNKLNSEIAKAKTAVKDAIKLQTNSVSIGGRLKESYKELGIDFPKELQKKIDGDKQWENELEGHLKVLSKIKIG